MKLDEKAKIFAIAAHSAVGQVRKYTFEPYWVHPQEVANLVAMLPISTPEMIAAAWLHDTVEDTEITHELILTEFGQEVSELVGWLTDISKPEDGPRATRKEIDRMHMAQAPSSAQTIKCMDLISNTRSIVQNDPKFARIYLNEKRLLLNVMNKAYPSALKTAFNTLELAEQLLN